MRLYQLFYPIKLYRLQRGQQQLQVQMRNCTLDLEKRELSQSWQYYKQAQQQVEH